MKKILALALTLLFTLGLVGCAKPTSSDFHVDVFWYLYSDTYLTSVRTAMDKKLTEANIDFTDYDCNDEQTKQNELVDAALSSGTDMIVVNIVDSGADDAAMSIVDKAKAAALPIVFFNRPISKAVVESYDKCVFVGTNADEAGYLQGSLAAEILLANYDKYDLSGDGTLQYVMFKGTAANKEADGRTQFSVEECNKLLKEADKPALEYYDADNKDVFQQCDWKLDLAQAEMKSILDTHALDGASPIEVIFANNDDMARGAIAALNEVGWNMGKTEDPNGAKTIPVFGVDATDEARALITEGKMSGTILQDADSMALAVVDFIVAAKDGKSFTDVLATFPQKDKNSDKKVEIPYQKVK